MHVNFAGDERCGLVLDDIENTRDYCRDRGASLDLRVVCHGPGLHRLRADTSPVRERLLQIGANHAEPGLYACRNTIQRLTRAEGSEPALIEAAIPVTAGLPEIVELQQRGFRYPKP